MWGLAGEFHDARDPWTLRLGFGQEQQDKVPEDRASVLGLGFGWALEHSRVDFGVVRRGIHRSGKPTSFDDRVVFGATASF